MALKWSWAFGPETALELQDLGGWSLNTTNPADLYPESSIVHTYTGDVADRYSLACEIGNKDTPLGVGSVRGWAACYFYFNSSGGWQGGGFQVHGETSGIGIDIRGTAANGLNLYIDTTLFAGTVVGLQNYAWNHIAVKYDMFAGGTPTVAQWDAELYVNGVLSASGSRTASNQKEEADTVHLRFSGLRNQDLPGNTFFSDFVIYDSLTDPIPYGNLVTRVEMDRDSSDTGSWTPASNTSTNAQSANLSGSISTTPVVSEADPLDGENIIISSSLTIGAQLGITPTSIYGVTGHLFASGSSSTNLFSAVAQGSTPTNFTSGTAQIDGENMYAWVTAQLPSLPSPNPWTVGSTIVLKAEVSGS
jgi:hypothetical protein